MNTYTKRRHVDSCDAASEHDKATSGFQAYQKKDGEDKPVAGPDGAPVGPLQGSLGGSAFGASQAPKQRPAGGATESRSMLSSAWSPGENVIRQLRENVFRFVVNRGEPFSIVEDEDFRKCFTDLHPHLQPPRAKQMSNTMLTRGIAGA